MRLLLLAALPILLLAAAVALISNQHTTHQSAMSAPLPLVVSARLTLRAVHQPRSLLLLLRRPSLAEPRRCLHARPYRAPSLSPAAAAAMWRRRVQIPPDFAGDDTAFEPRMQLVLFGDSLTQRGSEPEGWVTLLAHFYARKADTCNRGYSGYNSNHAVAMLKQHIAHGIWPTAHAGSPQAAVAAPSSASSSAAAATSTAAPSSVASAAVSPARRPSLVTLFFGANDSCLPGSISDAQHVPLDQYRANLVQIVQLLKGEQGNLNPEVHLVIIGPPQVDVKAWGLFSQQRHKLDTLPITRDNENTRQYSEAARSVAKQFSLPFIHTFSFTDNWNASFVDGLHFTPRANHQLFKVMLLIIKQNYPALLPQNRLLDSFPFLQIKDKELAAVEAMFQKQADDKKQAKEALQPAAATPTS